MQVVLEHSWNNSRRTIGWRRHNAPADRVLLVYCQGVESDPVHGIERLIAEGVALALELAIQLCGPPFYLKATGHNPLGTTAPINARLHHFPQREQPASHFRFGAPGQFVSQHQRTDRETMLLALRE